MQFIENKTFDEISIGDRAELSRTLTERDIDIFAIKYRRSTALSTSICVLPL